MQETLKGLGYDTSLNDPYAGAWVLKHHSSPEQGIHSLQIEIRRDLYMDENTLECHEGFNRLQNDLNDLMKAMRKYVNHQLKRKTKKTEKS